MELFWITEDGNRAFLYWAGSFEAPTDLSRKNTWNSVNNKDKTEPVLIASKEDIKNFTYNNGKISYEVSELGMTYTVTLVRSENDYSVFEV